MQDRKKPGATQSGQETRGGREARSPRSDGDATRALILEVAGRLFAERGYAETASKEICESAQANLAAVNYHFGSRADLYMAVLKEAHDHVFTTGFVTELAESSLPPREKLERLIDGACQNLIDTEQWRTRLFARELVTPSPLLPRFLQTDAMSKFNAIRRILAEVLELPMDDPEVARSILSLLAPITMLSLVDRNLPGPVRIILDAARGQMSAHMKTFVWAGLEAIREARKKACGACP